MADIGLYQSFRPDEVVTQASVLNQLVDITQQDISGSTTRKSYQVFVTGGIGPGVTSSLYQTVFDQDFSYQTANAIFDMTVGLYSGSATVAAASTGEDDNGKLLFQSSSLMMREKVDIYRQYAKQLLGNINSAFYAPYDSTDSSNRIDEACFISFKRLFARDKLKRETFAMRLFQSATLSGFHKDHETLGLAPLNGYTGSNIDVQSASGSAIFTDAGAASNIRVAFGGGVAPIVDSANTARKVGLIFYDHGTAVLDMSKAFWGTQHISGVIDAMNATAYLDATSGQVVMGRDGATSANASGSFIPDFVVSSSIDNIVDHIASTRFGTGSNTSIVFQNNTNINSTLYFCRASAGAFNYSSNPTFVDSNGKIVVYDENDQDSVQNVFTFPTTVGLYNGNYELLAVAKLSRPIEKSPENDVTVRVRLDF